MTYARFLYVYGSLDSAPSLDDSPFLADLYEVCSNSDQLLWDPSGEFGLAVIFGIIFAVGFIFECLQIRSFFSICLPENSLHPTISRLLFNLILFIGLWLMSIVTRSMASSAPLSPLEWPEDSIQLFATSFHAFHSYDNFALWNAHFIGLWMVFWIVVSWTRKSQLLALCIASWWFCYMEHLHSLDDLLVTCTRKEFMQNWDSQSVSHITAHVVTQIPVVTSIMLGIL